MEIQNNLAETIYNKLIFEEAVTDLSKMGLYSEDNMIILYDFNGVFARVKKEDITKYITGVVRLDWNGKDKSFEIGEIWAKQGYGPAMYILALEQAGRRGLTPSRIKGQVSAEAQAVWQKFYDGPGQQYATNEPIDTVHDKPFLDSIYHTTGKGVQKDKALRNHQRIFNKKRDPYDELLDKLLETAASQLRDEMDYVQVAEKIMNKITEGLTDIVYHGTSIDSMYQILSSNRVMTSVAAGVGADAKLNKEKFYFLSTARSINTFKEGFGIAEWSGIFVLDGRKLSQKYKGAAVDYWGPGFDQDETEDRLVTDDPYIENFSKYIKEVRLNLPKMNVRNITNLMFKRIMGSIDVLESKNIPFKIVTDRKQLFINNPKDFMSSKEEYTQYIKDGGYRIQPARTYDDEIGEKIRQATPYSDLGGLAKLIDMMGEKNLDFSSLPNKKKVDKVKNDLYVHLVGTEKDDIVPKYDDKEMEKLKDMMLKGEVIVHDEIVRSVYDYIMHYPNDFSPSIGTSIQNKRKDADARDNIFVISKYMRRNKIKDLKQLGIHLKKEIETIKDGEMSKVAEQIMDKMLEKKYDVNNPVLWKTSYSDMIHFANTGDFFIPLGEDFLKRALGTEPTKGVVFHVTDHRGVYGLINIQGTKKAIAGFSQLGDTVASKMFTSGVGAGRESGFVVKLEGDILTSFYRDARTRPEKGGRRNIKLATLDKSIGRQGFMKVRKEIIQKLHQYNEKMGAKSKIPTQTKLKKDEDSVPVLDAWAKQVMKATKPGPLMTRRYKEQGKPVPKGDGKKLAEMVKYYLDAIEEIVKNNQEMFKKAIVDANMGEKGGYTGYDEKNIENFRVKSVFLVKDSPAYLSIGKSDIVPDLKKENIPLHMVSQRQMLNHINGTQNEELGDKILKKFEEKSDWVPKGVVNRESYGDMIEFNSFYDLFFPLGSTLLKRALGDLPENVKGFHIGNLNGMKGLISIQGSKKQISTFTRGAKKEFIRDGITGRGGCVAEVEGRLITSSMKDIFSLPEKNGRRNILLGNLLGLIRDPSASDPIVEDLIDAMAEWTERNAEPTVVPKGSKMYQPEVVRAWNRAREDADGKMKQQMVKFYLDTTEAVMKKHSKTIEYALLNPFKSSVTNYTAMDIYDENVMDKIKVKNIYLLNTYHSKRGMVGYPEEEEFKEFIKEMATRGIDVYKAKAKEIVDMIDNSLSDKGATKYFEGNFDWDEFGFSDEERGESEPTDPDLQTLMDLDRDDKFTIGNRKPVYRIIGKAGQYKGATTKVAVIDGSAERKFYMIKVVDLPATVGAFEAINAAGDTGDTPKGKVGTVARVEEELTEAGGDLSYLLLPVGQTQQIGAEKQDKKTKDGIERYSNKFGSYRYVMVMDGETVGAIQVMSRDKSKGVAANVFVKPELRRQGIAKRLLVQAKKDFDEVEYNPDQSDDGKAWVSSVAESIYKKITKESQDPSTLSSIWNLVDRRDLSRLTQMMLSSDACCDTETISGLWDESDPQDAMFYLLPEPEWREWGEDDWEDEETWTEKEMAKRREHERGISMKEIYKSREELGELSRKLLVKDGIAQKSPDGSGAVIKVWRCGVTEGQPVTSVTWSEQYAYKFCTGKKAYHKDDTEVDAYYINLQDVLVSIPHIWESGYREWELLVHPKDLVPVQGYERKNNTSSISETVYNKILKGL